MNKSDIISQMFDIVIAYAKDRKAEEYFEKVKQEHRKFLIEQAEAERLKQREIIKEMAYYDIEIKKLKYSLNKMDYALTSEAKGAISDILEYMKKKRNELKSEKSISKKR